MSTFLRFSGRRWSSLLSKGMRYREMSVDITAVALPSLSPTMEAGTISSWLKAPGDAFSAGETICEIETDKAAVGFDVQDEGVLAKILVDAGGEEIAVGSTIALTVEDMADYEAFTKMDPSEWSHLTVAAAPVAAAAPEPAAAAPAVAPAASDATAAPASLDGVRISPAAAAIVRSQNLDVVGMSGTARHGLISKADVVMGLKSGALVARPRPAAIAAVATTAAPASSATNSAVPPIAAPSSATGPVNDKYTEIPNSNMRKIIAKRLTESKATVPHSYTSITCEIDELLNFRKMLKNDLGVNVSVNDFVIKSAALALRDVPEANNMWKGSARQESDSIDISIAVATPAGLITPILTHADGRGMSDINAEVKDLATRARDGKLKPEEFQGGTFTISNLGMFGISDFSAVINPPQACILAVGGGVPRMLPPLESGGKPRKATTLTVALSADRRVIDEAIASQFLQVFRAYLSSPKKFLL